MKPSILQSTRNTGLKLRLTLSVGALLLALVASAAASGGKAHVVLSHSDARLTQTSDTAWTLGKTGAVDTAASTVTWTITATEGSTVGGHLVVTGFLAVTNLGTGGATIGNIVVNLQTMSNGKWVTQSSDIADATHGDAATTAHVDPDKSSQHIATFTENAASGRLQFMDAHTNTAFSLVPEVTVAPGATIHLLFAAAFDNHVLALPVGTPTRTEVLVSFGDAAPKAPSAPDIDINGNGVIDADEAWVRTVSTLIAKHVPAPQAANTSVTLSDTVADITAMGTVTFTNPVITLGVMLGTVTVSYNGGASGGGITNCAHATGSGVTVTVGQFQFPIVAGVNLQACNTQTIASATCTAGTAGCGWHDGDESTNGQGNWAASTLLGTEFNVVYASSGEVIVGLPSPGFAMGFGGASYVQAYLPASGVAGPLDANLSNPTTSSSGIFGGDVLSLHLNVDFSDAGFLHGTSPVPLGNLTLCNFSTLTALNGMTVRQFLGTVNTLLGGGSATYSISDLDPITSAINGSFVGGTPSTFAQTNLVNGACP